MGLCLRRLVLQYPWRGGRVQPESVAAFNRNQWQPSTGIRIHDLLSKICDKTVCCGIDVHAAVLVACWCRVHSAYLITEERAWGGMRAVLSSAEQEVCEKQGHTPSPHAMECAIVSRASSRRCPQPPVSLVP